MVGHQAIGEDFHLVFLGILLEPIQAGVAIFVHKKDVLAAISTLSDMVRYIGTHSSGKTWHGYNLV